MAFWRLYYHLVWATRNREHLITADVENRLYPYLVNKAAESSVYVYAVNGWFDHIHLVVAIPPKEAVAAVVKRLKGASSYDLNHDRPLDTHFAWQQGYGVLSVGERQKAVAVAYVLNQKKHHEHQSVHPWLERYAEFDEGPDDTGIARAPIHHQLREPPTGYDAADPPW